MKLNNIIFDRIIGGVILNKSTGAIERYISELQNLSLETSADPVEITNKDGAVVYRKYNAKTLAVSATNAFISSDIIALTSGKEPEVAKTDAMLVFPKVIEVAVDKATLEIVDSAKETVVGDTDTQTITNLSIKGVSKSGAIIDLTNTATVAYTADGTKWTITLPELAEAEKAEVAKFMVKYDRKVASGTKITNKANEFPKTTTLLFKALAVDPCETDKLRACYIEIPSFMADPSTTLAINNSEASTMDFSGSAMVDVCSDDKELFSVYFTDDEE